MVRAVDSANWACLPRDQGLTATVRPLDDYSNTYIGLHVLDPTIGSG